MSKQDTSQWHDIDAEQAMQRLFTSKLGLSPDEAQQRLLRDGANRIQTNPAESAFKRLLRQFYNILIILLLVSGGVTALLGEWVDSAVIFGVVIINALVGYFQEAKAEKALNLIRNMLPEIAKVKRKGRLYDVASESLVLGDLVVLQAGDKVPADIRLISVHGLKIDESLLTGESVPVEKSVAPVAQDAILSDRSCLVYSGTFVSYGQGSGVVIATGDRTELGQISGMLTSIKPAVTPLLQQINKFSQQLSFWIISAAGMTFAVGFLFYDSSAKELLMAAVGLAVAAIPEGLPAIITIALAVGVQRMAKRNAIIRYLPAVETLGSVSVICTDKTGTLTRNEMTVQSIVTAQEEYCVTGVGYDPHGDIFKVEIFKLGSASDNKQVQAETQPVLRELILAATLCNDAGLHFENQHWTSSGDPTEIALVCLAIKAGLDPHLIREQYPRIDLIPFSSEAKFMASLHHDHHGQATIYLKGAPEILLPLCSLQQHQNTTTQINKQFWENKSQTLAATGMRVLVIACANAEVNQSVLSYESIRDKLTLLGLVALLDPPRIEAIHAIGVCQTAGIKVKIITGDHVETAKAVAERMHLAPCIQVLTGYEIDQLLSRKADVELHRKIQHTDVFARTAPEHKLHIVESLQKQGAVVAMTGDGVNDAPALKQADIGVAMGKKGSDVAKQASQMILADDDFSSIAAAVEEGRTVYDNIKKSILYVLPTSFAQAGVIIISVLLGHTLPISPVQILWVNMITAVTVSLSLAFEPAEVGVMQRPPRLPHQALLEPLVVWRIFYVTTIVVAGTFVNYYWELKTGAGLDAARTSAVNTLVFFGLFYVFNIRFLNASSLNRRVFFGNPYVLYACAALIFLQLLFTYTAPMQYLFSTAALSLQSWLQIIAVAFTVFLLVELEKYLLNHSRWR